MKDDFIKLGVVFVLIVLMSALIAYGFSSISSHYIPPKEPDPLSIKNVKLAQAEQKKRWTEKYSGKYAYQSYRAEVPYYGFGHHPVPAYSGQDVPLNQSHLDTP